MDWLLFVITINLLQPQIVDDKLVVAVGTETYLVREEDGSARRYSSMLQCFDDRDKIVEDIGRPIIDYQSICIPTTRFDEAEELAKAYFEAHKEMQASAETKNPLGLVDPNAKYEKF